MKKVFIGIAAAVAVIVIAGASFFFLTVKKSYSVGDVLKSDPLVYLELKNVEQRVDRISNTKLWNELSRLDYKGATSQLGVPPGSSDEFEKNLKAVFSPETVAALKMLFGKEVAIAVYPAPDVKMTASTPAEAMKLFTELAGNVSFVTRVGSEVQAAESMSRFFGRFIKELDYKIVPYKGKQITVIASKDGSVGIGYIRFNDLIVFGFGEKASRSAIDSVMDPRRSLNKDQHFLERRKGSLEKADTFAFVRLESIYNLIKEQLEQLAKTDKKDLPPGYYENIMEQYKQTQGIQSLVFSSSAGEILAGKANIYFDPARLHPDLRPFYACAPTENQSEKFVPWDAMVYQWYSCLDLPALYLQYRTDLALKLKTAGQKPEAVDEMFSGYEKSLGLSITDDILPAVGKEFGVYLTDVKTSSEFPVPKLVAFIQTTGRDKMEKIIAKLMALQPDIQFEEEQVGGEKIKYVSMPHSGNFQLAYTYIGNYFLAATSVDVLKESLEAYKDKNKAIGINSSYELTHQHLGNQMNSMFFVQTDKIFRVADDILDWSIRVVKQNATQRQAFLAGSQKNLQDLKQKRTELEANAQSLQAQLAGAADPALAEGIKQSIDASQQELAALVDREKELENTIKDYETKAPGNPADEAITENFLKPLLKALTNIKFFSAVTINREGRLESYFFSKWE